MQARKPTRVWLIVVAAGLVIAVAAWLTISQITATTDKQTAQVAQTDAAAEARYTAEQFLAACASVDQTTPTLRRACELAAQAAAKPVPPAPTTAVVPYTDAEMRALIVETIRANPGLLPRGADGKDAVLTDADYQRIADMVQARVTNGTNGKDGRDGRDAIVDYPAIVAAVLARIPKPVDGKDGAKGDKGADAPTITTLRFAWNANDSTCTAVLTLSDGTTRTAAAGAAACPESKTPPPASPAKILGR